MNFKSIHGNAQSDIFVCPPYELIRRVCGLGIDRVSVIVGGVKVAEIVATNGLEKAMDYCREHERLSQPIPENDFVNHCDMQR